MQSAKCFRRLLCKFYFGTSILTNFIVKQFSFFSSILNELWQEANISMVAFTCIDTLIFNPPNHFLWAFFKTDVISFWQHGSWLIHLEVSQRCQFWKDCIIYDHLLPLRSCPRWAIGCGGTSPPWPSSCSSSEGIRLHFGPAWRSNETCF